MLWIPIKLHHLAISVVATTDDDFLASRDSKVKSSRRVSFSRFKLSTISFCRNILCDGLSSFELIFFNVDISLTQETEPLLYDRMRWYALSQPYQVRENVRNEVCRCD